MKIFTFRYDPHPRKTTLEGISKAMKVGRGEVHRDEMFCRSMDDMMKIMTKSRFQVFTTIVEKIPQSMTELAEALGKDMGNVFKDVKVLESLGLIELKRQKGKRRERLKPVAMYDQIIFECEPKQEKVAI